MRHTDTHTQTHTQQSHTRTHTYARAHARTRTRPHHPPSHPPIHTRTHALTHPITHAHAQTLTTHGGGRRREQANYGNLSIETFAQLPQQLGPTGDLHITVYDYPKREMLVGLGKVDADGNYGPNGAWMAANRPFLRFDLAKLLAHTLHNTQ